MALDEPSAARRRPAAGARRRLELAAARRCGPSRRRSRRCRSRAWTSPTGKAGRKAPDRPPVLLDAVARRPRRWSRAAGVAPNRLALGGRSMGGRMCSMAVADGLPAAGPRPRLLPAAPAGPAGQAAHRAPPALDRAVPVRPGHPGSVRHARRARRGDGDDPRPGHPRLDRGRPPRPEGCRRRIGEPWPPGCPASGRLTPPPSAADLGARPSGAVLRVEVLQLAVRRLGVDEDHERATRSGPMASTAIDAAVVDALVEQDPASSRPMLDPTTDSTEMTPLALPRAARREQLGPVHAERGHGGSRRGWRSTSLAPHRPGAGDREDDDGADGDAEIERDGPDEAAALDVGQPPAGHDADGAGRLRARG